MANIKDLFTDLEPGMDDDTEIDLDKVMSSVTDILNGRPPVPDDHSPTAEVEEEEDSEPAAPGEEDGGAEEPEEELPPVHFDETPPPAPSRDPWLDIPAERRAAILALDETLVSDPTKRSKVFGILSGDSEAPVQRPQLPDHIDPDSFEATLWRDNQEMRAQIAGIAEVTQRQAVVTERERARSAATEAATRFGNKYGDKLQPADVVEMAQYAARNNIPAAFMQTAEAKQNPIAGYEQALEHVLWTNEAFRGRVLGTDSAPVTPPGDQPEAQERKRKLRALSGAASPVSGPAPQRPPLEHGFDGKLTEKSRQSLVQEAANMIRQSSGT